MGARHVILGFRVPTIFGQKGQGGARGTRQGHRE